MAPAPIKTKAWPSILASDPTSSERIWERLSDFPNIVVEGSLNWFGDGDYFRKGHTKSSVLTAWIDVNAYVFAPWPGIIRKYREGAKGRHVMYCALPVIMGSIDHACIK
jgi:hypothetical protein